MASQEEDGPESTTITTKNYRELCEDAAILSVIRGLMRVLTTGLPLDTVEDDSDSNSPRDSHFTASDTNDQPGPGDIGC